MKSGAKLINLSIPTRDSSADVDYNLVRVGGEGDVQCMSYSGFKYEFGTDEV